MGIYNLTKWWFWKKKIKGINYIKKRFSTLSYLLSVAAETKQLFVLQSSSEKIYKNNSIKMGEAGCDTFWNQT